MQDEFEAWANTEYPAYMVMQTLKSSADFGQPDYRNPIVEAAWKGRKAARQAMALAAREEGK
ncbi:MAG: hypothetical protein AAGF35_13550 [Pseudomonadota bacterium]